MSAGLVLMSAACSTLRDANVVYLDDAMAFRLLPPASFGEHLILTQLVSISYMQQGQAQTQQLLFYSEIDSNAVNVAGLLPDGTRLFSLLYDGNSLQSEGRLEVLGRIDPHYLLADMQVALWPLVQVRASLVQNNACFDRGGCALAESPDQRERSLRAQDGLVIDIRYGGTPHYAFTTNYQQHRRGYQLNIETLDVQVVGADQAKETP